uniref:Uncharacterized protein n=1 Tax=Panagrolaimus sp. ES5 TaxID=591445 RepID=A0AC34G9U8_9BILA
MTSEEDYVPSRLFSHQNSLNGYNLFQDFIRPGLDQKIFQRPELEKISNKKVKGKRGGTMAVVNYLWSTEANKDLWNQRGELAVRQDVPEEPHFNGEKIPKTEEKNGEVTNLERERSSFPRLYFVGD